MLVRPTTTLTYAGARLALDAAIQRAEEIGGAFDVAVTDEAGRLLAFARMDGAFAHSGDIAQDKAATVAGFGGLATDELWGAIREEEEVRGGIAGRSGVAAFPGGVPILVGGTLVGAVGVSGGSAAQDKDVAAHAASALVAAVEDG